MPRIRYTIDRPVYGGKIEAGAEEDVSPMRARRLVDLGHAEYVGDDPRPTFDEPAQKAIPAKKAAKKGAKRAAKKAAAKGAEYETGQAKPEE